MCRKNRRCPSYSDPVAIAARNARRRERYHARKLEKASQESNTSGIVASRTFDGEFQGESGDILFKSVSTENNQKLNLTVDKHNGALVQLGYFADKTFHGVINYKDIDESSYMEFGFGKMPFKRQCFSRRMIPTNRVIELSKQEVTKLSLPEQVAARFFTTNEYEWFNGALHGDETCLVEIVEGNARTEFVNDYSDVHYIMSFNIPLEMRTKETVRNTCKVLDSALEKGPKINRIVYRCVDAESKFIRQAGGLEKWMSENIALGKELKFDGYQSSSVDLEVAKTYVGSDGGLVFEIMTPEGVNISSISDFLDEKEVLLPRQSRYVVVGVHNDLRMESSGSGPISVVQLVAINDKGEILDGTNASPKTDPFENRE
jgi:hypothetical protein